MGLVDAGVDDADLHAAGGREGAEAGGVPALGGVDVGVGVPPVWPVLLSP